MPSLRRLSGQEVIDLFQSVGFLVISQRGSHVKLRRIGINGEKETLTIPNHSELDTGTLHAIIRQGTRYVPADLLRQLFYR